MPEDRNQPGPARPLARPESEFKIMGLGNLRTAVSNYGSVGDPNHQTTGRPSAEWPSGSMNNYLFDSGFWCSTIVGGEKTVSAYFYAPDTEWNPTDGTEFFLGGGGKSILDSFVEYDDFDEFPASDHIPLGIKVRRRGLSWSMPEFDDFIIFEYDVINTGLIGDISPFYCSFWYDCDVAAADATADNIDDLVDYDGFDYDETDTDRVDWVDPLDLDGDGRTGYDQYGLPYADPNNPLHDPGKADPDGYPDEYQIFVNSADVFDRDSGEILSAEGDTILIPRGMSYLYDWDNATTSENDIGERGLTNPECTGFIGGRLLYTEHISVVDDGYEQSPEELRIPYTHQWWNWESDPVNVGTDPQKYDYVIGRHEFSQGYRYLPNPLSLGAPAFDYRFLLSSGPFEFAAGDTIRLVWALCLGQGLGGLRENSDKAMEAYYQGSRYSNPAFPSDPTQDDHYVLPIPPEIPNLTYSPVAGGVKLAWSDAAEVATDQMLGITDFEGYKIYRAQYAPEKWEMIAAFDNRPEDPVYVVDTDGDTLNSGNPVDLPAVTHTYVDTGGDFLGRTVTRPLDGLPYYYAVVAFDPVKPEIPGIRPMLPSMESARTNYQQSGGAPLPIYPTYLYETGDTPRDLSEVIVAPNPYKGTSSFEARYESRIRFLNLPPTCKISIYTMAGDLVEEIEHVSGSDSELWDLISRNNQSVVSGLYIYVVETEADKHIGKFVIMR
ncbi:T9SS type A sorting domain-containing protein [candidate division KSB1 bacterium]